MRACVYLRVSTDEQAASGLGLDAQLHACQSWADREGAEVVGPFQDDLSGAVPLDKRPGLLDALAALAKGDVLLVAKRDRIGREMTMIVAADAAVSRAGCRIVSAAGEGTADDNPESVLMRTIVDGFAVYERLLIKARTRAALQAKKRKGERVSRYAPYGRKLAADGKTLEDDPAEVEIAAEARALHDAGQSHRKIAAELDRRGVPTKNGGPWSYSAVRSLIRPA